MGNNSQAFLRDQFAGNLTNAIGPVLDPDQGVLQVQHKLLLPSHQDLSLLLFPTFIAIFSEVFLLLKRADQTRSVSSRW